MSVVVSLLVATGCQAPAPAPPKVELPAEAIEYEEGHWALPDTLPVGPTYLVHDGEVFAMEYVMFPNLGEEMEITELPVGAQVYHIDIEFAPEGEHGGTEGPLFEVYLYCVPAEEVPH